MLTKIRNPVSIKPLEHDVLERLCNSLRVEIWDTLREPIEIMKGLQLVYGVIKSIC